ncbi:neuronal membrane glycoprotein M6-a-like [Rhopilema esculentum]|uniref:neuronal membrane glycoprotein M6-a-like n=1 Tax=Rhopilema esculentum TaxID=499914 RepID=UPI0031D7E706
MGCGECCGRFCRCCCSCFSRIPYGTTFGLVLSITGMLVFVGGFVTSLKSIDKLANIKGALDFGYTVTGVIIGASALLGLLILVFACCTSGDTRDNVYSGWKSKLFGKCFSSLLIIIEYLLYLAWALLSVFMVLPVLLQIMLNALCGITPKCINLHSLGLEPFLKYAKNSTINTEICADELKAFCSNVKEAGTPLIISLVGTLVAALGTVHVLMCLSSNFAYVKSYRKTQKNGNETVAMT